MPRRIVLVLQNIRSLHNVGSLFRSADVFGVENVYLCGYTGLPPRPEIAKVALGADTWIPWQHAPRTHAVIERLRAEGFQIIALETGEGAQDIHSVRVAKRVALVVGNEVMGITPPILRRVDVVARIPMYGNKESLNVAVAGGIGLDVLRSRSAQAPRRSIL